MQKIKLSEKQQAALKTVEWLIDDSQNERGSGRTFLLAVAFLNKAASNKGQWISIFDHYRSVNPLHLVWEIEKIAKISDVKNLSFKSNEIKISYAKN